MALCRHPAFPGPARIEHDNWRVYDELTVKSCHDNSVLSIDWVGDVFVLEVVDDVVWILTFGRREVLMWQAGDVGFELAALVSIWFGGNLLVKTRRHCG